MSGKKHGWYGTPEYQAWQDMKRRCYDKKRKSFKSYGARGIIVCDRWLNSFDNFINDLGERPSNEYSLDRIDNNGNYEPSNCKWSLNIDQQRNKRCNKILTVDGISKTQIEWITLYKIPRTTFNNRLKRGWDLKRALSEPIMIDRRNSVAK